MKAALTLTVLLVATPAAAAILHPSLPDPCLCHLEEIVPPVIDIYAGDVDPVQTAEEREEDRLHEPPSAIPALEWICFVLPHSAPPIGLPPIEIETPPLSWPPNESPSPTYVPEPSTRLYAVLALGWIARKVRR